MLNQSDDTTYIFVVNYRFSTELSISLEIQCSAITPSRNPTIILENKSGVSLNVQNLVVVSTTVNILSELLPDMIIDADQSIIEYSSTKYHYDTYYVYLSPCTVDNNVVRYSESDAQLQGTIHGYANGIDLVPFTSDTKVVFNNVSVTTEAFIKNANIIVEGDCTVSGFLRCNSLIL